MEDKRYLFVSYGLIGAVGMCLLTACSTVDQAGQSEFNAAMNACERMDKQDEREQCVDNAIAKQQAAIAKARKDALVCPASC